MSASTDQPTYRIGFHGERDESLCYKRTQPGQAGVSEVTMHPSGEWLITTCIESGQIAFVRIQPDTTMIIVDIESGQDRTILAELRARFQGAVDDALR